MSPADIVVPADQAEGTKFALRSWLKPVGAAVVRDEAIAEVETDKVTIDIRASRAGMIHAVLVAVGDEVKEKQPIYDLNM